MKCNFTHPKLEKTSSFSLNSKKGDKKLIKIADLTSKLNVMVSGYSFYTEDEFMKSVVNIYILVLC